MASLFKNMQRGSHEKHNAQQRDPSAPSIRPTHPIRSESLPKGMLLNANQLGSERQTIWTLPPNILGSGAK